MAGPDDVRRAHRNRPAARRRDARKARLLKREQRPHHDQGREILELVEVREHQLHVVTRLPHHERLDTRVLHVVGQAQDVLGAQTECEPVSEAVRSGTVEVQPELLGVEERLHDSHEADRHAPLLQRDAASRVEHARYHVLVRLRIVLRAEPERDVEMCDTGTLGLGVSGPGQPQAGRREPVSRVGHEIWRDDDTCRTQARAKGLVALQHNTERAVVVLGRRGVSTERQNENDNGEAHGFPS